MANRTEVVARAVVRNGFRNSGQVCVSGERIYVVSKGADQFEQRVPELAAALKIGPRTQDGIDLGPRT